MKKIVSAFVVLSLFFTLCLPVVASEKNAVTPSADFIIQRLSTINTVLEAKACTEETDPNNKLHKPGGYQDAIYFHDSQVDASYRSRDVVEDATSGGGSVEVFPTVKDAKKRNEYLACFDGQGFLDPGSHEVFGTCVIRTSRYLTATQQTNLTAAMKAAILADSVPGQVQNPTTVYNGVDYSAEYDAQTYYNSNPDLQAAFGTDGLALIKHYVECGKAEGRKAK